MWTLFVKYVFALALAVPQDVIGPLDVVASEAGAS